MTVNCYLLSKRKRTIDIIFAVFGILLLALISPFIAIATILTNGMPVFYKRERLGVNGIRFSMFKFRTMQNNATNVKQNLRTELNDPRILKIGKILRKTYIDELPQFWNVIKGEMSVVGPRPEFPELSDELSLIRKQFSRRVSVKPGITGLAQVLYSYSFDNEHAVGRLPYDLEYIKRASLILDLWIIKQTITRTFKLNGT